MPLTLWDKNKKNCLSHLQLTIAIFKFTSLIRFCFWWIGSNINFSTILKLEKQEPFAPNETKWSEFEFSWFLEEIFWDLKRMTFYRRCLWTGNFLEKYLTRTWLMQVTFWEDGSWISITTFFLCINIGPPNRGGTWKHEICL